MSTSVSSTASSDPTLHESTAKHRAYWSAVFAMTLCVFTLIASEFMPVSLLTLISTDLQVSKGWAGYGIAVSGAFAVLTSLSISTVAGSMNRKTFLLLMTGLMGVSALVVALATHYITYMIGRALIGVVVGGFWSMSAAVAMRLVPPAEVPKALAILNGGNALATVIAAPMGSYLGEVIGWRGAFLCLVPLTLIAFVWQWICLPPLESNSNTTNLEKNVFRLFGSRLVVMGMLAVGIFFMGQFVLYTYIRPFLETVTKVDVSTMSMMLLTIGIAGLIGTTLINRILAKDTYLTLVTIPLIMAMLSVALIYFGASTAAVFILLGLWGLVATAAPVGWWAWLARSIPQNAEAGGGVMVAVIQMCIAIGSTIGGLLFDRAGYRATFMVSAVFLVLAAVLAWLTARASSTIAVQQYEK